MGNVVAIVGKPNTGKSSLFNRIIKKRVSIIDDSFNVTRDRIYSKAEWLNKEFFLIDTGGIEKEDSTLQEQIKMQTEIAISEADVIVFLCDVKRGLDKDDYYIASKLLKSNKKVILAVNKVDSLEILAEAYEFYSLGLGDPIAISSIHGIGIGELLDEIIKKLPDKKNKKKEEEISFSFVGRPNVGKSSLVNTILKEERVIVSSIEGTTRDSIDTYLTKNKTKYKIIDTAGIKRKGKIKESIDKYAYIRALDSIDDSDVVCLVIDAKEGIIEQDKKIAGYALNSNKPIVIVVNKWDLVKKKTTKEEFEEKIKGEFQFLDYAFFCFVSAKENINIDSVFEKINLSFESYNKRVQTSAINEVVLNATIISPPKEYNGGVLKIYYVSQPSIKPPMFVFFVNNKKFIHFSYERYLKNIIRKNFGFEGTPIVFKYKNKF